MSKAVQVRASQRPAGGFRMSIDGEVIFETVPGLGVMTMADVAALERFGAALLRRAGVAAEAASEDQQVRRQEIERITR